jgi:hypothetical protein
VHLSVDVLITKHVRYKVHKLRVFRLTDYEILVPCAEFPGPKNKTVHTAARVVIISVISVYTKCCDGLLLPDAFRCTDRYSTLETFWIGLPDREGNRVVRCSAGHTAAHLGTGHEHNLQLATQLHI